MVKTLNPRRTDCCFHQISRQLLQHATGAWLLCVRNGPLPWGGGVPSKNGSWISYCENTCYGLRFGLHPCFYSYCLWAHYTCTKITKDVDDGNEFPAYVCLDEFLWRVFSMLGMTKQPLHALFPLTYAHQHTTSVVLVVVNFLIFPFLGFW